MIRYILYICVAVSILTLQPNEARPQITFDGTAGPKTEITGPDYQITSDLGRKNGSNLFHSFGQFNLNIGEAATFSGPDAIQNIIARITGGSQSVIDGLIRSKIPNADLYLLNPAGFFFGPHSSLDISGSFCVGAADYLLLGEDGRFDATNLEDAVLTSSPPAAFGFLDDAPGPITFSGSGAELSEKHLGLKGITVPKGKDITIVGGDIVFEEGLLLDQYPVESRVRAPSGKINLSSAASSGEAVITESGVDMSAFAKGGTISMSAASKIAVNESQNNDGAVFIRAGRFVMKDDETAVYSGNQSGVGGKIDLDVQNDVLIADASFIATVAQGEGKAGDIDIAATRVRLNNGGKVYSVSVGNGESGDVNIVAENEVFLSSGGIYAQGEQKDASSGNISISTGELTVSDGASVQTRAYYGTGHAGNISIAADTVMVASEGLINSGTWGEGRAGSIHIRTDKMDISNGFVTSSSENEDSPRAGSAGDINIIAKDSLTINGADSLDEGLYAKYHGIYAQTRGPEDGGNIDIATQELTIGQDAWINAQTYGEGKGGDMSVDAEMMNIQGGGTLTTSTRSAGDAGDISISAKQSVHISGSGAKQDKSRIYSTTHSGGRGGTIRIETPELVVGKNGEIISDTLDDDTYDGGVLEPGPAGDIVIKSEQVEVRDGGLISVKSQSTAAGGDILLATGRLDLLDNGLISAKSKNIGNAGDIRLNASGSIQMENSQATTEADQADGGNIFINSHGIFHPKESDITATVGGGQGDGGNIDIQSNHLVLEQSRIVANAHEGKGGNIQITADQLIRTPDSEISASSRLGIDGSVVIHSPETDVGGLLQAMPDDYLDAENWQRTPCAERSGENAGRFVMAPRDAVPTPFDDWLGVSPQVFAALPLSPVFLAADAFQRKGFLYKALDALQDAMDALENDDVDQKAVTMNALSDLHLCLGNLEAARASMAKGWSFARESKNPLIQAALWNNNGNLSAVDGDGIGAEQAYKKSLEWIKRFDSKNAGALLLKSTVLINLARLRFQMENDESFAAILQTALETTQNLPDAYPKAAHLTAIALLAEYALKTAKQDLAKLAGISKQAIIPSEELGKQLNLGRVQAEILGLMAGHFAREDRLNDADACLRNAIFTAQNEHCPEILYDLYRRRANVLAAAGDVENALRHCELALSTLTPIRSEFFKGYRESDAVFSQKVAPVYSTYMELLFRMAEKDNAPAKKEKRLKKARAVLDLQRIAELENYYQDECLAPRQAPNSPPYFLDDNAVVVYPVPLREKLALLLVFSDAIQKIDVAIDASTLRKHAKRMRRLLQEELTRPNRDLRSLYYAKKLYGFLIDPLEKIFDNRRIDTVVFCPDGQLRQLPFAALHDGDRYLVEKYAVALIPSLSSIQAAPTGNAVSAPLIAGLSEPRHGFPPIQNVAEEINKIQRQMGGKVLSDERFTRKNLMKAFQTTSYRIVHMATHGYFGRTSDDAYLLAYDAKITLSDLKRFVGVGKYHREAPIELIALSACQTAMGDERSALGLAGVSLRAGAKSAMATLWRVEDRATSELIGRFYAQLKERGGAVATALQQAQKEMLGKKQFRHPAFWAPFVIIGNWL